MKYAIILYFILMLCFVLEAAAQIKTVELDEVTIEALPFEKFVSGSKVQKSDSLQMAILGQGTLSDFMQQNTTVYIKESGNSMMASVSFRGTGSTHTGVYWHGINLNSLTLGGSDFNGFPLFLFDDIAVHYGGASSVHGSDAIGGSIHLGSTPSWTESSQFQLRQDIGSYGNVFSGIKLNLGNGKWESKTRIFNRLLKNNFNYNIKDRIGDVYSIEQKNAEVHNYGLLQQFNRRICQGGFLSLKGWVGKNYHQVQPMVVSSPDEAQLGDEIWDRNLKMMASYDHYFDKGSLQSGIGYVWDYQIFNESDIIETNRMIANLSYEWNVSPFTVIKAGSVSRYIVPNVHTYEEGLSEFRGDVFASINHEVLKNWQLSLNGRKTFVPFTTAPIAPSLSTSYLIEKEHTAITFRAQLERSYRVPSFNDRYWGDQGKPDLKSESGYSTELGHNFRWSSSKYDFEFDVSAFYMLVDDWIIWKRESYYSPIKGKDVVDWRPDNLKKVEASGIEIDGKMNRKLNHGMVDVGLKYAYNKTILLVGAFENDPSVGEQLPYTPLHRMSLYGNFNYKNFHFNINNTYTGIRNGADVNTEKIDEFFLTDISLSRRFNFGNHIFSFEGQVRNVFDVEYQNVNRYAMPGRNYLLSINYIFN